jgi:predicted unusual protein kinase regulating ubiquinone biosynthesis (AarF/ABC1/UbiB family)
LKGQEVVIKVQRPGLKDLFDIDLKNLRVSFLYTLKIPCITFGGVMRV